MIEFIDVITEELYCIVPKDIRRDIQCLVTFVDKISREQCIHKSSEQQNFKLFC